MILAKNITIKSESKVNDDYTFHKQTYLSDKEVKVGQFFVDLMKNRTKCTLEVCASNEKFIIELDVYNNIISLLLYNDGKRVCLEAVRISLCTNQEAWLTSWSFYYRSFKKIAALIQLEDQAS